MAWDRPILTDSGGYQVFSLNSLRNINDDGVRFQSHLDGSSHFLSPESAVDIQRALGADIMMVLDDCLAYPASHFESQKSMKRSLAWASRCRKHAADSPTEQALFGIFLDMRLAASQ
jgi:queuine tRNA-ribosyltransferase